jgi:hypothetical protein
MSAFSHTVFTEAIFPRGPSRSYTVHPIPLCMSYSFSDWSVLDTNKFSLRCFLFVQLSVMMASLTLDAGCCIQAKKSQLL